MAKKLPKIGKYVLDTLSIGMYNSPLMLIREYIQNSTDAIDELEKHEVKKGYELKIEINVDGRNRTLKISDNGIGIPAKDASKVLLNIGESNKDSIHNRGFRGIGRLGGVGYCDRLKFKTKYIGETKYSVCDWDCNRLRRLIKNKNKYNASEIIKKVTDFKQLHYQGNYNDHFFIVEMGKVQSSRDILMNVPFIKNYLSQVLPVSFNKSKFSFSEEIDVILKKEIPKYKNYNVYINKEKIYKPYSDSVILRGKIKDKISKIEYIELKSVFGDLALAWIAKLKLYGSISPSCLVEGIRVRSGNILIGNKHLLDEFFRERRFYSYLVGELHIKDHRIVPNSRRDDFEDNEFREELYDSFIKNIGLPYSRMIRQESIKRNAEKNKLLGNEIIRSADNVIDNGYYSEIQKNKIIRRLKNYKNKKNNGNNEDEIVKKMIDLYNAESFFSKRNSDFSYRTKCFLQKTSDIVFQNSLDEIKAEKIVERIINRAKDINL